MTKEEYVAARKSIAAQKTELYKQEDKIFDDYRAEHRKFNEGDKVRLTYNDWRNVKLETIVFISSCNVHDNGDLYYGFRKLKKDGSLSNHRFRGFDEILSIELVEPAKP